MRSPHEPIRGLLFAACLLTLPPTAAPAVPCPSVEACAPVTVDGVRGAVADLRALAEHPLDECLGDDESVDREDVGQLRGDGDGGV